MQNLYKSLIINNNMTIDLENGKIRKTQPSKHVVIESIFVVSLSVLFMSLGIIAMGFFRESFVTGAIIGTRGITSYAIIIFVFSLIATFFLSIIRTRE